jgi:hypothetical protein
MERYFEKMKDFFINHKIIYKNLPQCSHMCHGLGDIECFFNPIFQNFAIKVLKMKWNNQGVIHPHTCQGDM